MTNHEKREGQRRKGGDDLSAPSCFHSLRRNNIQVFKEVSEIPFNFACWISRTSQWPVKDTYPPREPLEDFLGQENCVRGAFSHALDSPAEGSGAGLADPRLTQMTLGVEKHSGGKGVNERWCSEFAFTERLTFEMKFCSLRECLEWLSYVPSHLKPYINYISLVYWQTLLISIVLY